MYNELLALTTYVNSVDSDSSAHPFSLTGIIATSTPKVWIERKGQTMRALSFLLYMYLYTFMISQNSIFTANLCLCFYAVFSPRPFCIYIVDFDSRKFAVIYYFVQDQCNGTGIFKNLINTIGVI